MISITAKVWQNRSNKQKLVTIPKNVSIQPGDTVIITEQKSKKESC